MQTITIAREMGAIDLRSEEELCKAVGLRFIHKSILEQRFEKLGMDVKFMRRYDERKPGVVASFLSGPDVYWETLRTAILQEAAEGSVAIVGRGANFLLEDLIHCLRLRFVAPLDFRVERVAAETGMTRKQAKECVQKCDQERKGFCLYYYGRKWQDPSEYDLTINTAELNLPELTEVVKRLLAWKKQFPDAERNLKNALLAQSIRYAINVEQGLSVSFLKIECDDGAVSISGAVSSRGISDRVQELVEKIDGVRSVENNLEVVLHDIPMRLQ